MIIVTTYQSLGQAITTAHATCRLDRDGNAIKPWTYQLGFASYPVEGAYGVEDLVQQYREVLQKRERQVYERPDGWHGLIT